MMTRVFAAAALMAMASCDTAPVAEYRPGDAGTVDHALCLLGFTAVPLRTVRTGHHLVEARINKVSGQFVLDTGANVTVVERAQAERLGIDPDDDGRFGLGASVKGPAGTQAGLARIDSFEIGPIAIRQKRVVTADIAQLLGPLGTAAGTAVAGIIGQDVLTEHRAIIDVKRPMLYLMNQDRAPSPVSAENCRPAAAR
jgi:predicted aspartyl protease